MKRFIRSILLVAAGVVLGVIGITSLRPGETSASRAAAALSPLEAALDRPIPEIWYENVPLTHAAADLSKRTGVPIEVDAAWMEQCGLSPGQPITVRLRNVDLMSVLGSITQSYNADRNRSSGLSGGLPVLDIGWCVAGEGILVGVWDRIEARTTVVTRIYDITPLAPDAPKPQTIAGGNTCFGGGQDMRDDLVRVIHESIKPESWWETGGRGGISARLGNRLVVVQSLDGQVQVGRLLDELISPPAPLAVTTQPSSQRAEGWIFHPTLKRWTSLAPERADAALWRVLPSFELADMPLTESLERLAFAAEFDVLLHDRSFDARQHPEGNLHDRRVTLAMRGAPVWRVLREILDQAAGRPADSTEKTPAKLADDTFADVPATPEFTWWLDGAMVIVGRPAYAESRMRVYDIRAYLGGLLAEQAAAVTRDRTLAPKSREEFAEDLMQLVEKIDSATWRVNGGTLGDTKELSGQLIISQTWENHEYIRPLIEQFTRAAATQPIRTSPEGK